MELNTLDMTRNEWLEARRTGIGGSDVASILGFNKYTSPYQIWLDKTGQLKKEEDSTSEPAYWGNVLEEVVAKEFTERTGKRVRRMNRMVSHKDYPFLLANIDRDVVGEPALLECKTASPYLAKYWEEDRIPEQYIFQIQHYLNVLEKEYAYVAVLIGGQRFVWKRVERDQELIDIVQERLVEFWEVNVKQMIAPPIDGSSSTTEFLNKRYADHEAGKEITFGSTEDELIRTIDELKETKKTVEESIRMNENQLKLKMGEQEAEFAITPNHIIQWKPIVTNRLDSKLLKAEHPDLYEKYTKESSYKKMTIKGIN